MSPARAASRLPPPDWSEVENLVSILRRRWSTGRYLRAYASNQAWEPVSLPVRGPSAAELLDHFDEAVSWAARFEAARRVGDKSARFGVEHRIVRGRNLGTNRIPARICIESFDQLCGLLGTHQEVKVLDDLVAETRARLPEVLGWVVAHPLAVLDHRDVWSQVLATVAWIVANETGELYLRQIDVDGVDTKFVEQHRRLLYELLSTALPPGRIRNEHGPGDFARKFGFLAKPAYTRFRLLDQRVTTFGDGISELTLRTDELAKLEPEVSTVFVVENEVTYLAFPEIRDSIVVFGSGFALGGLAELPWLHAKEVVYWGDIDTHGFDILNRLRERLGHVRSVLMDRETLVAHRDQWGSEPTPTRRALPYLTETEAALYLDLVENRYGQALRLEQERVRFSLLRVALGPWAHAE